MIFMTLFKITLFLTLLTWWIAFVVGVFIHAGYINFLNLYDAMAIAQGGFCLLLLSILFLFACNL